MVSQRRARGLRSQSVPVKFAVGPTVPNPLLNQSARPSVKLEPGLVGSWLQPQRVTQAVGHFDAATVSGLNKQITEHPQNLFV